MACREDTWLQPSWMPAAAGAATERAAAAAAVTVAAAAACNVSPRVLRGVPPAVKTPAGPLTSLRMSVTAAGWVRQASKSVARAGATDVNCGQGRVEHAVVVDANCTAIREKRH